MFEEMKPIFLYCVSPVHMGAGSALGVVDNPIQREKHTGYPMVVGSGLKGAMRHDFAAQVNGDPKKKAIVNKIFGPEPGASSDHAGAVSFGDAQLVAFPVRCMRHAFVYVTSPALIARVKRTLGMVESEVPWDDIALGNDQCFLADRRSLDEKGKLILEAFEFTGREDTSLKEFSKWLSRNALPQKEPAFKFFRDKLQSDLVVLSDEDFHYFVFNSTVVEPHVRINDESGTAEEGGLFYTENLPPETLLLTLAMTSKERVNNGNGMSANEVMQILLNGKNDGNETGFKGIDSRMIQIGGDATTGRGQVFITALSTEKEVSRD